MQKDQLLQAVRDAIVTACEKNNWTLKALAAHVGKSEDTLANWRDGKVQKFDLDALREIFLAAGTSMDRAFGIPVTTGSGEASADAVLYKEVIRLLVSSGLSKPDEVPQDAQQLTLEQLAAERDTALARQGVDLAAEEIFRKGQEIVKEQRLKE
ncbi:hypothetical protein JW859_05475 [bacterium]|nr:hypothetical protein [bacterium]